MKTKIAYADEVSNLLFARLKGDESSKIGTFCEKPHEEKCRFCWAETLNMRFGNKLAFDKANRDRIEWMPRINEVGRITKLNAKKPMSEKFPGLPLVVFCCDTFDIFQPSISDLWRDTIFSHYDTLTNLILLVQTTYPARMNHYFSRRYPFEIPAHYRIGMSAGTQDWLDRNLHYLKGVKAAFRYVIFEPLLEKVSFAEYGGFIAGGFSVTASQPIHQVIVGGESGASPRPMRLEWARSLKAECERAGVLFFMKQESKQGGKNYKNFDCFPADLQIRQYRIPRL